MPAVTKPGSPSRTPSAPPVPIVARYEVGAHAVRVTKNAVGRWAVAIDESAIDGTHATQAEAWEAGVREVDRRSRNG